MPMATTAGSAVVSERGGEQQEVRGGDGGQAGRQQDPRLDPVQERAEDRGTGQDARAQAVAALAMLAHSMGQDLAEADWWRLLDALLLIATHPAGGPEPGKSSLR